MGVKFDTEEWTDSIRGTRMLPVLQRLGDAYGLKQFTN